MSVLISEQKIADLIVPKLKELLGGTTLLDVVDKYSDTHRARFEVSIIDGKITGSVWLEDKAA